MNSNLLDCIEIDPEDNPTAAVIWLHGLGADGHDFEPIVPELRLPESLAIRYVFPHAPMRPVTINAGMVMRAWFDILDIDLKHNIDLAGFLESADHLRALIEREIQAGMASERIVVAGFSQGGAVALHTALRYEKKLAGIIALSSFLPTASSTADERAPVNADTPVFMGHGSADPMVPIGSGIEARQELTRLKYDISWQDYPIPHSVCPEEIEDIRNWLVNVLMPKSGT